VISGESLLNLRNLLAEHWCVGCEKDYDSRLPKEISDKIKIKNNQYPYAGIK